MRTIVFTVHEPPNPPADRIERAEQLEFVRDGFSAFAAAIPPLWMLVNKLWLALLLYLLVSMGLSLALAVLGVDKELIGFINLAGNVILGFEAASIQRWTLNRRDWEEVGTVVGRNRAECERRFFDGWLTEQPLLRRQPVASSQGSASPRPPKLLQAAPVTAGPATMGDGHPFGATPADFGSQAPEGPHRAWWQRLLRR